MSISAIPGSPDPLARLQELRQPGRPGTSRTTSTATETEGSSARAATAGGSALTQLAADLVGFLLQAQGSAAPRGSAPPPAPPQGPPPVPPPGPPPDAAGTDATTTDAEGAPAAAATDGGTGEASAAMLLDRLATLLQMRPPPGDAAGRTGQGSATGQATGRAPDSTEANRPARPDGPPPMPARGSEPEIRTASPRREMVETLAAARDAYAAQSRGTDGAAQDRPRAATNSLGSF